MVYTDINPLSYVLTTARLNAAGQHWVAELADFNFTIKYRPGKTNANADGLSRMPLDFEDYMNSCTQTVTQDAVVGSFGLRADTRDRFFWPNMHKDIEHFVTNLCECLKKRRPNR